MTETTLSQETEEATVQVILTAIPSPIPTLGIGSTIVSEVDGMRMVYIPEGFFLRGTADKELPDEYDAKPQRSIYLDAFWIDLFEVTNGQYALCVEAGACNEPSTSSSFTRQNYFDDPEYDNYPVIFVKWADAKSYCHWAGRRLPFEAEWEKAARGTDGRLYPWGNEEPNLNLLNFGGNTGDTTPVGSYSAGASPFGVLDMAGNVWEWVRDWYFWGYYSEAPERNPEGPVSGNYHVLRGGSWDLIGRIVRVDYRWTLPYGMDRSKDVGFRCAMDAE
jgi:formylglycine-generating enzyme required for sulfatase activity